ncbi:hypothetical protein [Rhodococcus opacus]|uniref:hypothetical protein n=1 Tax=Rhodococcus opacus TaxID=37919 RepID=UPI001F58B364|nr:hypothetical protein [Rhodococcus opacus]UNN05267.1 hypothetical protein MOO23_40335 [Rhodococcus opacus]
MTIDQGLRPRELPAAAVTGVAAVFPDLPEAVAARIGRSVAESRSEGTRRTYASAWRRFERWCTTCGHTPLPAHPATVAAYLVDAAGKESLRQSIEVSQGVATQAPGPYGTLSLEAPIGMSA